jgi:Restriction endonuclease
MPKTAQQQKGDSLEDAVRAIEESILRAAPGFAEGTFKIQGKRIINSAGVRHEVDLFVTAALPNGYEATFIFECKNWQSKVGKNEIIVFSEKVASLGASKGFFVAQAFTKDARAQAAKDRRVTLLTASHVRPVITMQFPQLVQLNIGKTAVHLQFGIAKPGNQLVNSLAELDGQVLRTPAETSPAREYVTRWIDEVRHQHVNALDLTDRPDGQYTIDLSARLDFDEGTAALGDESIRHIALAGTAEVAVARAAVLSIFEVQSRGRLLKVGIDNGGLEVRADIVELP